MLRTALGQHSDVACLGEILLPMHFQKTYIPEGKLKINAILDGLPVAADKRAFGFSILYNELFRPEYMNDLTNELVKRRFAVIHVVRDNLLRRYVSNHVARMTRVWTAKDVPKPTTLKVTVSCARLYADMRRTAARAKSVRDRFRALPVLELTYEDLCADFSGNFRRVCEFLSVAYEDLQPRTLKQENRPLREAVANYDRLKLIFALTPYQRFFDE